MKRGSAQRQDHHYQRKGTCCVLIAVEPLAGKRMIAVKKRRTKQDYALFMKQIEQRYSKAEKIMLVPDKLNTHNPSSFYETFSPESAFGLAQRFQMIYTPKKASWLNMAEIELSALSKQCLDRRLGTRQIFSNEVSAWVKYRNRQKAKVVGQFTKNDARKKLARHYDIIRN